jgi:hypothetical protein
MKSYLIPLFFLLLTEILHAQTDFRPGFVIKNSGDTLRGQIDYRGDVLMGLVCKFKDTKNTVTEYSPNDIAAFRFIDSKYYVSREVDGKMVFLEYLIRGKISIYYIRDDKGDRYFLDKEGVKLTEIPYKREVIYVDDKYLDFESKKHIGLLKYYTQDAPQFKTRIESMKKPEHENLIKFAKDYHKTVCKDEQCIVYERKQPGLKVNLEILAGVVNFANLEGLIDKNYAQGGFLLHFWLPRTNEKIYFKTGILFSQSPQLVRTRRPIKIPTHIGYLAPKTYKIRPSFSIGLLSPSYSGGFVVRLNKGLNIGIQGWANFFANDNIFIIPDRLNNHSILCNMYIEM